MFRPLKKREFNDFGLKLMMQHIFEWADQFRQVSLVDGRLVENFEITTSGVSVEHKLGREPKGWIVVRKTADVRVWETDKSSTNLDLDASGTATISIWVF